MKNFFLFAVIIIFYSCFRPVAKTIIAEKITLPNGWSLTPAGRGFGLGDLPLNMAISPSGKMIAVSNNGQSGHSLQLVDVNGEKVVAEVTIPKAWYGLKFSADGKKLYAAAGYDNMIRVYDVAENRFTVQDSIVLGDKMSRIFPTGIEIDHSSNVLFAVTKENNKLYTISLSTKQMLQKTDLPGEAYMCLLNAGKTKLYISCWGCDKVLVYDIANKSISNFIAVGDNPNEMLFSKDGKRLFVANANDNSVSVIDVANNKVMETLNAALYPHAPSGSTTNGLALSEDGEKLFIANADNNCLAVFDVEDWGSGKSEGFIPTGWYPTNVKVVGKKIFVTNGKGFTSMANPYGPNPYGNKQSVLRHQGDTNRPAKVQYIAGLFKGTMSVIDLPTDGQMGIYSKKVYDNTPYNKDKESLAEGEPGNPIPMRVGDASPIKHVFYVIKENRTYDQVLGDIPEGNGDTSLVLFGEKVTPNQHKLVREFVLLDNFYVDAEVSADGHNWSMGAYATDYLEKTWPTSYGGRGGKYDAEGFREIANNKGGFIWDHCKKNGVSFRTYGEFADNQKPNIPVLGGHICLGFKDYDLSVQDTTRFRQWRHDFDSLVAINALPQFMTVRFGNDHTEGLRRGRPTPAAHVADNDLAVGKFIEYLSLSPIWKESAVFIIEDDAQNGADHVDAHRSTAYLAGPFVKRGFVDHTMYSTTSMLRTMELILGMPPMTQYDAAAMPMWRSFTATPDYRPFRSLPNNIDLGERNVALNKWQQLSETYNFAKEDAAPDIEFAEVLWHAVKGGHILFPGPKRAAFLKVGKDEDD